MKPSESGRKSKIINVEYNEEIRDFIVLRKEDQNKPKESLTHYLTCKEQTPFETAMSTPDEGPG